MKKFARALFALSVLVVTSVALAAPATIGGVG